MFTSVYVCVCVFVIYKKIAVCAWACVSGLVYVCPQCDTVVLYTVYFLPGHVRSAVLMVASPNCWHGCAFFSKRRDSCPLLPLLYGSIEVFVHLCMSDFGTYAIVVVVVPGMALLRTGGHTLRSSIFASLIKHLRGLR